MAKFEVGHAKLGGRVVGSPNKRTLDFQRTMQEANFDVATALLEIHRKAMYYEQHAKQESKSYFLKIALDAAKEIASYTYPKLKSVEHKQSNMLEGMTAEQKLEAMKQAVAMLEAETKK